MRWTWFARLTVSVAAAGLTVAGCTSIDRAGGAAGTTVTTLTLGNPGDSPDRTLTAFASDVAKLSHGTLKIEFKNRLHTHDPTVESEFVNDVKRGSVDLAWVGARVFDRFGVRSFEPMLAPMLIDSEELQGKVFEAGIPEEMLADVDTIGVVGVGVLPGPLRRPLSKGAPLTSPAAFRGKLVATQGSDLSGTTYRALGSTTRYVGTGASIDGVDAYDIQIGAFWNNHYEDKGAKSVAGNVNLWPRPLAIIAAPQAWGRLTADQRKILRDAATVARGAALDASRAEDTDAVANLCKAGIQMPAATAAHLAEFEIAFKPIYDELAATSAANRVWLEQIRAIKNATGLGPDTVSCAGVGGEPPGQATDTLPEGVTFSTVITPADFANCTPGDGPETNELVFRDGLVYLYNLPQGSTDRILGFKDNYSVFRDKLIVGPFTVTWKLNGKMLTLSDLQGGECGDRIIWTSHPWTRK